MGYGDDLMVTAIASKIKRKYPHRQIIIGNLNKKEAYHSIIYENNPNITDCRKIDLKKPVHMIDYHNGNRPYIDYENSKKFGKYIWNLSFRPQPGEFFFSKKEKLKAKKIFNSALEYWKKRSKKKYKAIIFLENSSTKIDDSQLGIKHQNKDWGKENWANLINEINNEFLIIQPKHNKTEHIENTYSTNNINFREACAVLNHCDLYLGPEGGFGHAAAALNKKAVIYFGGWISPETIGYSFHDNVYFKHNNSPCGEFQKICDHCQKARKSISVKYLSERVRKAFRN
tara:strand:+ start:761 stop:1618 length:858 start_codon:yes stop_codon:yes gene_type:complete